MIAGEATRLLFGIAGQSLYFDAPQGRPSSVVTVELFEDLSPDSSPISGALGAATIESATTTLAADLILDSATNVRLITVADESSFALDRRYQLVSSKLWTEWVEPVGIDPDTHQIYLRDDLTSDWLTGDSLVSTRIVIPVDDTWVATDSYVSDPLCPRPRYRIAITYVVAGHTYRVAVYADLVRYDVTITVTALDVNRLSAGWLNSLAGEDRDTQGADTIAESFQQVKYDLWEHRITAYAQRNSEVVNELVKRKAVALVHEQAVLRGGAARELADYSAKLYWDRFQALVDQSRADQQTSADGAGGQVQKRRMWSR